MRFLLVVFLAIASFVTSASAQKVRIVTRDIEPFSFERDGRRTGFAMELWDNVARELKLESEVSLTDSAKKMVEVVQARSADVAVGALSITAEREQVIDFSQPFYESGLQILVTNTGGGMTDMVWTILKNLFSWQLVVGFGAALVVMFLISHLVWMYEHPVNEEMWPRSYLAGMGESFWWTVSIFLVGGADNKGPVGLAGRIIATVWMLASVIAVSLLTALLSAQLTVSSLNSDIKGPIDLPNKTVATVGGSTAEAWLKRLGTSGSRVDVKTYANPTECLDALKRGQVKAVVYDAPILKYYLNKFGADNFALVDGLFERNNYGFGLAQDSSLRERINQALLKLNENGVTDELKKRWFGAEP